MTDKYTNAKFWKCALQVNPVGYIQYRGQNHGMTEDAYNQKLLDVALENEIKVIGLADHGNVDGVDAIRTLMNSNGILVFPGFEISSSEKVHFVCLYPEETTTIELHRFLGNLDLLDPENGIRPSRLSAEQLLKRVEEDQHGFIYAAHCTEDSGLLYRKMNHVWQSPLLKAAQIPGTLEDLKNAEGSSFRQILQNKTPEYKRELPIGVINAKDVAIPDDLSNSNASCLIKMTNPCFASFKLAFQDPESRVRLNSDLSEHFYSRIESLKVTGGYLDGVKILFSDHLNAVIGGRGTGKSTLIECLRYVLELRPISKNALKQHEEIIKENLGRSLARVEVVIRSSKMNGRRFTVARRYGESSSVKDENGLPSTFTPADLLAEIEIYGQNEIYEIAQDKTSQRQLLSRFLESSQINSDAIIHQALSKLAENRRKLIDALNSVASIEDEVARLPKLEEQVGQYRSLGLEDKLKIIPYLETEKRLLKRVLEEEGANLNEAFQVVRDSLPDTIFLDETALLKLPHADKLGKIRKALDHLRLNAEGLLRQWDQQYAAAKTNIELDRKAHV